MIVYRYVWITLKMGTKRAGHKERKAKVHGYVSGG